MKLTNLEDFGRAMDAVLDNGVALIEEAELLFANRRFARAYALALLACEEFTKIWSIVVAAWKTFNGEPVDWRALSRAFRDHRAKFWRHVMLKTFTQSPSRDNGEPDQVTMLKSMLGEVHALVPTKNAAIYVDIGEDIIHTPADAITEEMSANAIQMARRVSGLHAACQLDFLNRLASEPLSDRDREKQERMRTRLTEIFVASGLVTSNVTEESTT